MLAAVFEGNGRLVLKDRPKPDLENDTDASDTATSSTAKLDAIILFLYLNIKGHPV